jgi:hypothetical protein
LPGRHQTGGQAPPAPAGDERHPVGSGHDGQKPGTELPFEQALRQRDLSGAVRVHGFMERLRVHVSRPSGPRHRHPFMIISFYLRELFSFSSSRLVRTLEVVSSVVSWLI